MSERGPLRGAWAAVALALGATGACDGAAEPEPASETAASDTSLTPVETPTTAVSSFEVWRSATRAVCLEFEPQQDALVAQLGQPSSLEEAAAFFQALMPVTDAYVAALTAIEVPSTRSDDVERTYELYAGQQVVARAALDAANAGDGAGFQARVGTLQTQSSELERRLVDLGLPECVPE